MPIIPSSHLFDQHTLTLLLDHDPLVQRYRAFFALFDWRVVPESPMDPSQPGKRPHPPSAYIKALLLKLEEDLITCTRLRRFLVEHPLLVLDVNQPYGFDIERTVPTARWLREKQRTLEQSVLQALLIETVQALRQEIPGLGEIVAFDVTHIYAWVRENNPRVYVTGLRPSHKTFFQAQRLRAQLDMIVEPIPLVPMLVLHGNKHTRPFCRHVSPCLVHALVSQRPFQHKFIDQHLPLHKLVIELPRTILQRIERGNGQHRYLRSINHCLLSCIKCRDGACSVLAPRAHRRLIGPRHPGIFFKLHGTDLTSHRLSPVALPLSSQNPPLPVSTQPYPIISSKDPSFRSIATPVMAKKPVARFARMAPAGLGDEPLLNGSQVTPVRFLAWGDAGLDPWQMFLSTLCHMAVPY